MCCLICALGGRRLNGGVIHGYCVDRSQVVYLSRCPTTHDGIGESWRGGGHHPGIWREYQKSSLIMGLVLRLFFTAFAANMHVCMHAEECLLG